MLYKCRLGLWASLFMLATEGWKYCLMWREGQYFRPKISYICLDCVHVCVVVHLFGLCNYMCSRSYICLDCVNQLSYPFSLLRLNTWVRAVLHAVQQFFSNCCFNLQREQNIIKECLIHNTLQIYVTVWYFPINVCVFLHTSIKIRRNFSISFRCFKTYSVSIFSSWCKVTKIFEKWWCI